jgi:hypothetical protein
VITTSDKETTSMTTAWSTEELDRIGAADELDIAARRRDGTLRTPTTIWVVRSGNDLFVRSYRGLEGAWYRGTKARREGHIRSAGVDKDVTFVAATDPGTNAQIDDAYRGKYRRYGSQYVDPMIAGVNLPSARRPSAARPHRLPHRCRARRGVADTAAPKHVCLPDRRTTP